MEERCTYLLGVGGYCVQRNINIAIYARARGIIKGDNIRIIVVLEKFQIHGEYLLVVAEDIVELTYGIPILSRNGFDPLFDFAAVDIGHWNVVGVEGDHLFLFSV